MAKAFSYNKKEKLKSRKQLDELFTKGKTFSAFPVKVFYKEVKGVTDNNIKVGVGVGSKYFKKAVDRNRIKRLLREAYRLNKTELINCLAVNQKQIAAFFLYVDKVLPTFELVSQKTKTALDILIKQLSETHSSNT
jgi:ribonuclease P protein component